jgi:hypothetical protein
MKKYKDLSQGMVRTEDLANLPDQIDMQGGYRKKVMSNVDPAETLSDVISKIKSKGGSVARLANSPLTKKLMMGLAGPAGVALSTAQDAMASEDLGAGSDLVDPLQNEEALMNIPSENFADPAVSEQARRWQKIRGLMGN